MKFLSACVLALASVAPVLGMINNKAVAATTDKEAKHLKNGYYRFVNVKTGHGLLYKRNGQEFFPSKGSAGSWMRIRTHHKHVILSPKDSNNKCISAQWNYDMGKDWAGAVYECDVTKFRKRGEVIPRDAEIRSVKVSGFETRSMMPSASDKLEKRLEVRPAKQYWWVHPGDKPHTYHIVTSDHSEDMHLRGMAECYVKSVSNNKSRYVCLKDISHTDKSQLWYAINTHGKKV